MSIIGVYSHLTGSANCLSALVCSLDENHRNMTLGQIYNRLLETYCGRIGYQYMHLHSREETAWIQVLTLRVVVLATRLILFSV